MENNKKKILYFGDSITDTGRNANNGSLISIGQGYTIITASKISMDYIGEFEFENTGISGNRIVDLYSRIKSDCWNRNPDVLSVLVGINDSTHNYFYQNGVEADRFYRIYSMMVKETIERFPNIKIMIMEPFVLEGPNKEWPWDLFKSEVKKRSEAVQQIARENGTLYIPLQKEFDEALKVAPSEIWTGDGVHPTLAGHQLIANKWLKVFEEQVYPTL